MTAGHTPTRDIRAGTTRTQALPGLARQHTPTGAASGSHGAEKEARGLAWVPHSADSPCGLREALMPTSQPGTLPGHQ